MNKELEFNFEMLSQRQLLKLCASYNVFIQGAMPNHRTSKEQLLELVNKELEILPDGTIQRKDNGKSHNMASLSGGSALRVIII